MPLNAYNCIFILVRLLLGVAYIYCTYFVLLLYLALGLLTQHANRFNLIELLLLSLLLLLYGSSMAIIGWLTMRTISRAAHNNMTVGQSSQSIYSCFFILVYNINSLHLTLILRRSRTGTVWFYTSTSNKRAARPKLYTKSLTRDLKRMYSRLTLVRISINL